MFKKGIIAGIYPLFFNAIMILMTKNKILKQILNFVKLKHCGQTHAGGVPVWHHLWRVAQLIDFVLKYTKEGNSKERFLIFAVALGHDLLEDTDAAKNEISSLFGKRCLALILRLTNCWGDKNPTPYVKQVIHSEEIVRIIKLADLYDNISNVTYNLRILGKKWTQSYFLPIVAPMKRTIIKTTFSRYGHSAEILTALVNAAETLLMEELNSY